MQYSGVLSNVRLYTRAVDTADICVAAGIPSASCAQNMPADGCRCPALFPIRAHDSFLHCVNSLKEVDDAGHTLRVNALARPASMAMDGDADTYWRSPKGVENVSLTIDVQGVHEFFALEVAFLSDRPHSLVMERSTDGGRTFVAQKLFSANCLGVFGRPAQNDSDIESAGEVTCTALPAIGPGSVTHTLFASGQRPEHFVGQLQDKLYALSLFTHLRLRLVKLVGTLQQ